MSAGDNITILLYHVFANCQGGICNIITKTEKNICKKLEAKNQKIIPLNQKIQIHGFADNKQENNFIISSLKDVNILDSKCNYINFSDIIIDKFVL